MEKYERLEKELRKELETSIYWLDFYTNTVGNIEELIPFKEMFKEINEIKLFPTTELDTGYKNFKMTAHWVLQLSQLQDKLPEALSAFQSSNKILTWLFYELGTAHLTGYLLEPLRTLVSAINFFVEELRRDMEFVDIDLNDSFGVVRKWNDLKQLINLENQNIDNIIKPVNEFYEVMSASMWLLGSAWSTCNLDDTLLNELQTFSEAALTFNEPIDWDLKTQGLGLQISRQLLDQNISKDLSITMDKALSLALIAAGANEKLKDINTRMVNPSMLEQV